MDLAISDSGFGYIIIKDPRIEYGIVIPLYSEIKNYPKLFIIIAYRISFLWKKWGIFIKIMQHI